MEEVRIRQADDYCVDLVSAIDMIIFFSATPLKNTDRLIHNQSS
jgi:hypothetical protein